MVEGFGGDLRKMIMDKLGPQIITSLQHGEDIQVYEQSRSIMSAVQQLYEVGSPIPATLILLFSVIVPLTKGALVGAAMFVPDERRRRRMLQVVVAIAKWSMADVFVVALFIAYLAAHATQDAPGDAAGGPPLVAFTATFGAGFYWFTAYCLFSLGAQQLTARLAAPPAPTD
jgi:hypothetical protein